MKRAQWRIGLLFCVALGVQGHLFSQFTVAHTLNGNSISDRFGTDVNTAGDVNGDGIPDVIVGAVNDDLAGGLSSIGPGAAYVYSGSNGALLHVFGGVSGDDDFGSDVAGAGDVNNDGFADLIVGAPLHDPIGLPSAGMARVFSGVDGSVLYTFYGSSSHQGFGGSVDGLGDVDGDGIDDFAIGGSERVPFNPNPSPGIVRVYSGATGTVIVTLTGDNAGDGFGTALSCAGDVDGDGIPDLIVGAPFDDNNGLSSGSVRVFSGATWMPLYNTVGDHAGAHMGLTVSGAGDVDRDGFDDLIVGAPYTNGVDIEVGCIKVFSGATGSLLYSVYGQQFLDRLGSAISDAGDVNGDGHDDVLYSIVGSSLSPTSSVIVMSGIDGATMHTVTGPYGDTFGRSVSGAGDLNGDGFDDLMIGAPGTDTVASAAGEAQILLSPQQDSLNYESANGSERIDLRWHPVGGAPSALTGDLRSTGASAGAAGFFIVSLAPARIPIMGFELLVAVDPNNLVSFGSFTYDAMGEYGAVGISRQHPAIAGFHAHVQWFEFSPVLSASNGIRLLMEP